MDRVLNALAEALDTEEKRWRGVDANEIWKRMPNPGDRKDAHQVGLAMERAEREDLLTRNESAQDHILLSPAGWRFVAGAMPGTEKDKPVLDTLLQLWHDPSVRR